MPPWPHPCRAGPALRALLLPLLLPLLPLLPAAPLRAQEPLLALEVAPGSGALSVVVGDLLGDEAVVRALHSGLPVRVRVVAELWRDRLFDSEVGRAEWRATVVHEPLAHTYRVEGSEAEGEEPRVVVTLEEARRLLRRKVDMPLAPPRAGSYYYIARMEVETLSLSDLDELRRWLRGDLGAAVAGDERMEGALARGFQRALVRALGIPTKRLRVRTPRFQVG